ncbi:MAG: choice-of-anchor L domain-containing protein [Bacteroidota bacterium]
MKTTLGFFLVCLLVFFSQEIKAQLTVTDGSALGMTPAQLVQNWLVGQGVIISNVTYNGSSALLTSDQVGSFTSTGAAYTQLGLDAGLLMTNGKASVAIGPNNSPGAGDDTGGPGDPDLSAFTGGVTYDRAVIEFDFIPYFDTIKFNYAFGSEEFYEFCYQFNDAFGFFLSGPGITGPYSNNSINIALMPGSSNPVTINNICANPASAWSNAGGTWFQYDAISYVFTARHAVTPCSTYHIKLAIADALDHILDAGVFLRKGSFGSTNVTPQITYQIGSNAIEGCGDATVHYVLNAPLATPDTLHLVIGGTATNCVDYTCLPSTMIIPAGQLSASLVIHAFSDNLTEGTETVILGVQAPACSGMITLTDTVFIADDIPLTLLVSNDTITCPGDSVTLHVIPQGGQFPFHYLWSTGNTNATCTVLPSPGVNNYTITVIDTCGHLKRDTIRVTANALTLPFIKGKDLVCGNGVPDSYITEAGMNNYVWTISPGGMISSGQGTGQIQVTWTLPGNRWVGVSYSNPYGCNGIASVTLPVVVFPLPGQAGTIMGDSLLCAGTNNVQYSVAPVQFAQNYDWNLPPGAIVASGAGTPNITVSFSPAAQSGDIVVTGVNACGQGSPSPLFPVTVNPAPVASAGPDGTSCQGLPFTVTQATAANYSSILWTSGGAGTLSGETTLAPVYMPDSSETGSVTLAMVAEGNTPCGNDTSRMVLHISPKSTAYAGPDIQTCDRTPVLLSAAVATHPQSLLWQSSGTGTFDNPCILHPVYTPGPEDLTIGSALLSLTTIPATPCPASSSSLVLHLSKSPAADAGPAISACGLTPATISGSSATDYSSLHWSSSGTGIFDDPSLLHPLYSPGSEDLQGGQVTLSLVAASGTLCRNDTAGTLLRLSRPAEADAGPDDSVCRNSDYTVTGATAKNYISLDWTHNGRGRLSGGNSLSPVYSPGHDDPGTVILTMVVDPGLPCQPVTRIMHLAIVAEPVVYAGADQSIAHGTSTKLAGEATGGSGNFIYEWKPAGLLTEFSTKDPETVRLTADTAFVLWITDRITGCKNADSVRIKVGPPEIPGDCLTFYNVITPNGDGTNDTWIIDCIGQFPNNKILIFNRWGEEVADFQNYNNSSVIWKGTNKKGDPLPDGTYFFVFSSQEAGTRTGWVYVRGN